MVVFQEVLTIEYKPEIMHSVLDLGELSAWLKQGSREWQAWLTVTCSLWINRAAKEAKKAKQATKKTAVSAAKVRCSRRTETTKYLSGIYQVVMQHSSHTSLEILSCVQKKHLFTYLDLEARGSNFCTGSYSCMNSWIEQNDFSRKSKSYSKTTFWLDVRDAQWLKNLPRCYTRNLVAKYWWELPYASLLLIIIPNVGIIHIGGFQCLITIW